MKFVCLQQLQTQFTSLCGEVIIHIKHTTSNSIARKQKTLIRLRRSTGLHKTKPSLISRSPGRSVELLACMLRLADHVFNAAYIKLGIVGIDRDDTSRMPVRFLVLPMFMGTLAANFFEAEAFQN
jgi:hypothetical protein